MMRSGATYAGAIGAILSVAFPSAAFAQAGSDPATLTAMDVSSLRNEIQTRYDLALAASTDPAYVNASDSRYIWAIEAKVQCGIALGFLKSSTKDATSISKCSRASELMTMARRPAQPVPAEVPVQPAAARPAICAERSPILVFFDFDSASPPPSAQSALEAITQNATICRWSAIEVVGHTDLAGSAEYNVGLSQRRADAIGNVLTSSGIPLSSVHVSAAGETMPRVPTADGVRNPENRRVEISTK